MFKAVIMFLSMLPSAFANSPDACKKLMQGRFAIDLSAVTEERQKDPRSSQVIELKVEAGVWKGLASNQGQSQAFTGTLRSYDSRHPGQDSKLNQAGGELCQLTGATEVCWMDFDVSGQSAGTTMLVRTDFSKAPSGELQALIEEGTARSQWQMDVARLRKVQYLLVESKLWAVMFTPMVKLP